MFDGLESVVVEGAILDMRGSKKVNWSICIIAIKGNFHKKWKRKSDPNFALGSPHFQRAAISTQPASLISLRRNGRMEEIHDVQIADARSHCAQNK